MLAAQNAVANGSDPAAWVALGTVAGIVIGALATAWLKISSLRYANKRTSERDAIADYQKLLDMTEAAKEKAELSKEKIAVDMNATIQDNLRFKAMVADKDEEIALLRATIAALKKGDAHCEGTH